ncbi:biotin/lipoate A/B protein ligase family protein [Kribbella sp. NPDC051620]|uniref:biotin/lipoate A/B protein ligase family protein n=1 Tax=Kribbella sp. NPDC051620 TaxID=3364120 RepID=UPI00378F5843
MLLFSGALPGGDEAMELAVAHALVRQASTGEVSEALRIYRPAAPVVVFGRRDTRLPGFDAAVRSARAAGFEPLVRAVGGRPVAYTPQALVIDHVKHEPVAPDGLESRFQYFGNLYAEILRDSGIDARVGAVPGEYCPGAHSVNARGTVKLVGTGQRVVRNAWLFSTLIILGDDDQLRPLLTDIYRHLNLPFDAASVGSLSSELPTFNPNTFEQRVTTAYGVQQPTPLGAATIKLAATLTTDHRA